MYGQEEPDEGYEGGTDNNDDDHEDIEITIRKEVQDIKRPKTTKLFTAVKIDVQCRQYQASSCDLSYVRIVDCI